MAAFGTPTAQIASMMMKHAIALCLMGTLGILSLPAHSNLQNTRSHLHGTSIFHWTVRKALEPPAPAPELPPYGTVRLTHKIQGKADKQGLLLVARRLEPNTPYRLWAWFGEKPENPPSLQDPNPQYIMISTFLSSSRGTAILRSRKISTRQGPKTVQEKFKMSPELDPLQNVQGLVVTTAPEDETEDGTVVLTADLSKAERFQILVRRELENVSDPSQPNSDTDAEAVLRLKGHHRKGWFRLYVAGLEPNSSYALVLNDKEDQAEPLTTNDDGCVNAWTTLETPADMLGLRKLTIKGPDGQAVLTTDLLEP